MDGATGMRVQMFYCGACSLAIRLTVIDRGGDGAAMDRFRLLAASQHWVIDLNDRVWCPEHRHLAAPR